MVKFLSNMVIIFAYSLFCLAAVTYVTCRILEYRSMKRIENLLKSPGFAQNLAERVKAELESSETKKDIDEIVKRYMEMHDSVSGVPGDPGEISKKIENTDPA